MYEKERLRTLEIIKHSADWNLIANWSLATAGQLAGRIDRFLASDLRESLIAFISKQSIEYIDQHGADLSHISLGKIEVKYSTNDFLYSFASKNPRTHVDIVLVNTNSKEKIKNYKPNSSFIICGEPHCFSLLFYEDLINHKLICNKKPGQIIAKNIPKELFYNIIHHTEFKVYIEKYDLEKRKEDFKSNAIKDFVDKYQDEKEKCKVNLTPSKDLHKIDSFKKGENIMNIKNYKKDGSTQKAYDLILAYGKSVDVTTLQRLFEKERVQKSNKSCWDYLNSLVKSKKLIVRKKMITTVDQEVEKLIKL